MEVRPGLFFWLLGWGSPCLKKDAGALSFPWGKLASAVRVMRGNLPYPKSCREVISPALFMISTI